MKLYLFKTAIEPKHRMVSLKDFKTIESGLVTCALRVNRVSYELVN